MNKDKYIILSSDPMPTMMWISQWSIHHCVEYQMKAGVLKMDENERLLFELAVPSTLKMQLVKVPDPA